MGVSLERPTECGHLNPPLERLSMKLQSISGACKRTAALALMLGLAAATSQSQAQTFSVLHPFTGGHDGGIPLNGLTQNGKMLFGTTSSGGTYQYGVVFRMNLAGGETVLHNFAGGTDGAIPHGGLVRDKAGYFYGTTTAGGALGLGTVFKIKGQNESVLYSFTGKSDGAVPEAGLTLDTAGNIYGTTTQGGSSGNGTVFEVSPPKTLGEPWTEKVLYSFGKGTDGAIPIAGVSLDSAGNLYGTTSVGGTRGFGTVFQLKSGKVWTETILHNFQNADDGAFPYAGFISDAAGNFYGAATQGGTRGGGTIFELSPSNGGWNFAVLYSVPGSGISGSFRNLVLDPSGTLYGTTHCDGNYGAGTVYKLRLRAVAGNTPCFTPLPAAMTDTIVQ